MTLSQPLAETLVECLLERQATLAHPFSEQGLHIAVEGDRRTHMCIIASIT